MGFHYGSKDDHLKHLPKKDFGKYSLHNQLEEVEEMWKYNTVGLRTRLYGLVHLGQPFSRVTQAELT